MKHPQEGGSYVRQPDGSLKRAGATDPAPAFATEQPGEEKPTAPKRNKEK